MKKLERLTFKSVSLSKQEQSRLWGGIGDGVWDPSINDYTYELPEVTVYGKAVHTGTWSTCPQCSKKGAGGQGSEEKWYTLGVAIFCAINKGNPC